MICPHCHVDRRQRERTGHTCSNCRKVFALDPKVEPGRLHDTKFRELVAKAAPGGLRITVEQLYWVNERRLYRFPTGQERRGSVTGGMVLAMAVVLVVSLSFGIGGLAYLLLDPLAFLFGWLSYRQFQGAKQYRPPRPFGTWVRPEDFERRVAGRWRQVYGALPDGLAELTTAAIPTWPTRPRAVVLCELPGVFDFLHVNGFAERHRVALARTPAQLPAGLPVVVVRDLSLTALARTARLRAELPDRRVVDCGLLPRAVDVPARAVRLRTGGAKRLAVPDVLAGSPGWQRLPDREREWLLDNWSSPLIALPPVKLMALLDKAVERAVAVPATPVRAGAAAEVESPAETRRRAERIGFLTWPQAVPAPRTGTDTTPAPHPTDDTR
ncbi:hypothetical protein [Kitasatospora sp. NPDC090308]|uniref:hypothetical protein n=1 Tax=Kitasatospora sp. NPDC090308 TaxID=3364082 RepID=UPI003813DB8E